MFKTVLGIDPNGEFLAVARQMALFDAEFAALVTKLENKSLILANHTIYSAALIGGKSSVKLIDPTANKGRQIGYTNLEKARLDKDRFFMPIGIDLRFVTDNGLVATEISTLEYRPAGEMDADRGLLVNGEYNFKARNMNIVQDSAMTDFDNRAGDNQKSYHPLSVRRIIKPQDQIEFELLAPSEAAFPADHGAKVLIVGLVTVPNS